MPPQPKSFVKASDGFLLIADGINKAKRWDGFLAAEIDAGVAPPDDNVVITFEGSEGVFTAGGTGNPLAGPYTAFARLQDRWGNFSNLSPISNSVEALGGDITNFASDGGGSPVWEITTDPAHRLIAGDGMHITGTGEVELDDRTHTVGSVTSSTVVELTLAFVSGSGTIGTWQHQPNGVTYTNLPVPGDNITGLQLLRNITDDTSIYYVDADISPAGLRRPLRAHWRFEETSGNAIDEIDDLVLTDENTVGTAAGKVDNARDFESGNSESFVLTEANAPGVFSFGDVSFGIGVWVNLESVGADRTIVSKWGGGVNATEWVLDYANTGTNWRFRISDGVSTASVTWGGTAPSVDTWYYVNAWYDASRRKIYITQNRGVVTQASLTFAPRPGNADFKVGALGDNTAYFDGKLDELSIYDDIVEDFQSALHYNSGTGIAWPFNFSTFPTAVSSRRSDDNLATQEAVQQFDENDLNIANKYGILPNTKSVLATHLDRVYALGDVEYTQGNVIVTNGSAAFTGINTEWTEAMEGREVFVRGGDKIYTIDEIDASAQTGTFTEKYGGTTSNYTEYGIQTPVADRGTLVFSEPGLPQAFPAWNRLKFTEDGDRDVGAMEFQSYLYVLKQRHLYRLSAGDNPLTDGQLFLSVRRGCTNNRCWVTVEDMAYLLDREGVYAFAGGREAEAIDEAISEAFDLDGDSDWKINWKASKYFHANHDEQRGVIRWFVSLSGDDYPRHALCFDYGANAWWVEEFPFPVVSSAAGVLASSALQTTFLGCDADRVFSYPHGSLDGLRSDNGTVRGLATSAGLLSLTDSQAAFSSSVAGCPLRIVHGTGKGQKRLITSLTGTTQLNIDLPWLILPDTTSVYQVGGIQWLYRTGRFRYADDDDTNIRRVEIVYRPTAVASQLDARFWQDQDEEPVDAGVDQTSEAGNGIATVKDDPYHTIDPTKALGVVRQHMDHHRETYSDGPRFLSVELSGVPNQECQTVKGIVIDGVGE